MMSDEQQISKQVRAVPSDLHTALLTISTNLFKFLVDDMRNRRRLQARLSFAS